MPFVRRHPQLDDLIFTGLGDRHHDRRIQRANQHGNLIRIHQGIYTANKLDPIEAIVPRNAFSIAGRLFPGAIVSARSALEMVPSFARDSEGRKIGPGYLYLTIPGARRNLSLPGLEIRGAPGPGVQKSDYPFYVGVDLIRASIPRMLLENLVPSRSRDGVTRAVGRGGVEDELDHICRLEGEAYLNQIRDEARQLAPSLDLEAEFQLLDEIIGAMLGTREARLTSMAASARADGFAYDPECLVRLKILAEYLKDVGLPERRDTSVGQSHRIAASFIESYFSNYIEGTRFPVRDAVTIVLEHKAPQQRSKDGHDVLAVYDQLVTLGDRVPSSLDWPEFLDEIKYRHTELMRARPENGPGEFKLMNNEAGNTLFVRPDLVEGTLKQGFELVSDLAHPFAKAIFIHFLLADVHPFADGNGRLSRIMMTKELIGHNLSRIIIPTVYRDDYLSSLRAHTRHNDPGPIVRAMDFCQRVTIAATAGDIERAIEAWASAYAFVEPGQHARLTMPDPGRSLTWRDGVPAPVDYWEAIDKPDSLYGSL